MPANLVVTVKDAATGARSPTTAGSSRRTAPSGSIPSARSTPPGRGSTRTGAPARRCRWKAAATTSTPATCRWWRRAASDRSRARPARRSLANPTACDVGNGVPGRDAEDRGESQPGLSRPGQALLHLDLPGDGVNTTLTGTTGPTTVTGQDVPFDIARDCGPYSPTSADWTPGGHPPDPDGRCAATPWAARRSPAARPRCRVLRSTSSCRRPRSHRRKIAVFVFQDDYPLNGEEDTGGGVDVLAPNEAGLGGFNLVLLDQAGACSATPPGRSPTTCSTCPCPTPWRARSTRSPADACPIAKNGRRRHRGRDPDLPEISRSDGS